MRPIVWLVLVVALSLDLSCDGGAPARSAAPATGAPAAPAAGPDGECVRRCVDSRQMEARAIEAIRADCQRECGGG